MFILTLLIKAILCLFSKIFAVHRLRNTDLGSHENISHIVVGNYKPFPELPKSYQFFFHEKKKLSSYQKVKSLISKLLNLDFYSNYQEAFQLIFLNEFKSVLFNSARPSLSPAVLFQWDLDVLLIKICQTLGK